MPTFPNKEWIKENHAGFWLAAFLWVGLVSFLWYELFIERHWGYYSGETGQTAGYLIGGIGVAIVAMVSAGRRTHAQMKQVENDQARVSNEQARVTNENFTSSIELLGNDDEAVRHGGLFALQRMMRDESLYPTIVQIVTSYIRHKSQHYFKEKVDKVNGDEQKAVTLLDTEPMKIDVEAALSVLTSRHQFDAGGFEDREIAKQLNSSEDYLFDLSNSKLFNADLSDYRLNRFNLSDSLIRNCVLKRSSLIGANLTATDFSGTDLSGADLTRTIGLTQMQIDLAIGDATTKLPVGLQMPASWSSEQH